MTSYRVTLTDGSTVKVTARDKQAAGIEAVRTMVRIAKAFNAKWNAQHMADTHESYSVRSIRKAPTARTAVSG